MQATRPIPSSSARVSPVNGTSIAGLSAKFEQEDLVPRVRCAGEGSRGRLHPARERRMLRLWSRAIPSETGTSSRLKAVISCGLPFS